jgi:hypothetical protein
MPKPCSRWPDITEGGQRSAETRTTDLETSIASAGDKNCGSDTSTATHFCFQHGGRDSEKGRAGVAPFIERNPHNVTSTLEWHSQGAALATNSNSCQQTAEEIEIEGMRRHYRELERILEREIEKHEERYEWLIEQLEEGEKDEKDYLAVGPGMVGRQPDYQPTECGNSNDGS